MAFQFTGNFTVVPKFVLAYIKDNIKARVGLLLGKSTGYKESAMWNPSVTKGQQRGIRFAFSNTDLKMWSEILIKIVYTPSRYTPNNFI